jgi:hypothetical protein
MIARVFRPWAIGPRNAMKVVRERLSTLIWKILHEGIRYEGRSPAVSVEAKKVGPAR